MKLLSLAASAFVMLGACYASARAGDLDGYRVVQINNGMNSLKIRGNEALVFRAWRENYNAHGFDVITFYLRSKADGATAQWGLVPIFSRTNGDEKERLELTASGGADCQLHDFRLLVTPDGKEVRLIVASRDMGESYADDAAVHFDYYALTENSDGTPGRPTFYFKALQSVDAKTVYCDVNEALDKELHLGTSSGSKGSPGGG
jgi:hypothetical protein